MFIKNTLKVDDIQDELIARNLLRDFEDEGVFDVRGKHYRGERIIKLMIQNESCTEFVELMRVIPSHKHIYELIRSFQENGIGTASIGKK